MVTNGLNAAITVREGGSRVIVLGGLLTPELSTVRPGTVQNATSSPRPADPRLRWTVTARITFFDPAGVEVRRMLVGSADRDIVTLNHNKFDHKKAMVLGRLDLLDVLVTDHTPPEPLRTALAAASVEVVVCLLGTRACRWRGRAHQAHRQGGGGGDRGMMRPGGRGAPCRGRESPHSRRAADASTSRTANEFQSLRPGELS